MFRVTLEDAIAADEMFTPADGRSGGAAPRVHRAKQQTGGRSGHLERSAGCVGRSTCNIGALTPIDIEEDLKKSFMAYAMAVIVSRALPDVRDGLKPVHRRILYAMTRTGRDARTSPTARARASSATCWVNITRTATRSVYDAHGAPGAGFLHPLSRWWTGQGNFGSVDGDGAAAMRYTEARMSKLTMEMLRDIDKETVDFYPELRRNADAARPCCPARFPNLLVNGSQRHRGRHGDEHSAAQPRRGHRRRGYA